MNSVRFVFGAATGALGLVLVLQNGASAQVQFLFWSVEAPIYLLLAVVLVLGLVAGHLLSRAASRRRRKRKERELER